MRHFYFCTPLSTPRSWLGAVQVRDCAEGQRAGQPGQWNRHTHTQAHRHKGSQAFCYLWCCCCCFCCCCRLSSHLLWVWARSGAMAVVVAVQWFAASAIDCPWINKTHFNRTVAEHTQPSTPWRRCWLATCVYKVLQWRSRGGGDRLREFLFLKITNYLAALKQYAHNFDNLTPPPLIFLVIFAVLLTPPAHATAPMLPLVSPICVYVFSLYSKQACLPVSF